MILIKLLVVWPASFQQHGSINMVIPTAIILLTELLLPRVLSTTKPY